MAIENTDLLYVQRPEGADAGAYKIEYEDLKDAIVSEVPNPVDAYTKAESDAKYFPFEGGRLTGAVNQQEAVIVDSLWNLSVSNFWACGAIDIPSPINAVNGQSGLIRFVAAPTSFPSEVILPSGFNITAACIVPFYVAGTNRILLGNPVEVS